MGKMGCISQKFMNHRKLPRISPRKQKRLIAQYRAIIDKPDEVRVDFYDDDIIYHKGDFWGIYESCVQNIVIYREKSGSDILYYVADFLLFLRLRCRIEYAKCKGRKDRYDFFCKIYGRDFAKSKAFIDGESLYYIHISDNAVRKSREIKRNILFKKIFTKRRKNS